MKRGPLTDDIRSKEYYRIAYQCLELVHTKGCNNNCAACPLNVHLYCDDVREATLIKTSAAIDYKNAVMVAKRVRSDNTWGLIGGIFALIFSLAMIFVTIIWPVSCAVKGIKNLVSEVPTQSLEAPTAATVEYTTDIKPEVWDKIYTVSRITAYITNDISNDGQVNCIDRALRFYEIYGPDCRIIWSIAPDSSFSHLFVAVPNGYGSLVYIDSSRTGSKGYMLMQNVFTWFRSVPQHDVTQYYRRIKNNTMAWVLPLP